MVQGITSSRCLRILHNRRRSNVTSPQLVLRCIQLYEEYLSQTVEFCRSKYGYSLHEKGIRHVLFPRKNSEAHAPQFCNPAQLSRCICSSRMCHHITQRPVSFFYGEFSSAVWLCLIHLPRRRDPFSRKIKLIRNFSRMMVMPQ